MREPSLVHIFQPALKGEAPHPAIILLHGLGSNERDLVSMAPTFDPRLAVISIRAPLAAQNAGGYMWFDYETDGLGLSGRGLQLSLRFLESFLASAIRTYDLDARRVVLAGFSMGCAMTGAFAMLHPEQLLGAIMLSGWLPADTTPPRYDADACQGLQVFQSHGVQDPTVDVEYGRQTRDALLHLGVDLTYREYPIGHEVSAQELDDMSAWLTHVLDNVLERSAARSSRNTGNS